MTEKLRDTLHNIFFGLFVGVNLIIFFYLKYQVKNECECANNKVFGLIQPLDYIIWFSLAASIMGAINLFINLNKGLSSLPLLGTAFNFIIAIMCISQIYMISQFVSRIGKQQCKEINKCQDKNLKIVGSFIIASGYFIYIVSFILAILLVWL